ncbi:protein LNK2-like isoform X2 [Malus sylvestris]|uniref:protein LNK2-like isoform X2 n=1 Tax=Malus sylvestris TaxID=3752 RepID=UPI0021AC001C|nr:protein LNK2-like isoform X2 [Malus sylvestris]
MFDWNDEELANIIWSEAGESDDHIVPYNEASEDCRNKKEWKQESHTIKPTEQKTHGSKFDLQDRKLESSPNFDTSEGISTSEFGMDSWPDSSLANVAKSEQHCIAEAIQLDKDGEIFQNSNEGKEQGDIVDYGWANIGSFDDLDRIFSNDDTIFGNVSLGNADELWSSSRDATDSPIKAFPVSSDSPSFTSGYGKMDYSASYGLQNAHAALDHVEYAGGKSKTMEKEQSDMDTGRSTLTNSSLNAENSSSPNETADKVSRQKKLMRYRKKLEEKSEEKSLQDFYGTWPSSRTPCGHFENQLEGFMVESSPSTGPKQKRLLQGPEPSPYQHIPNQCAAQSMYGNLTNPSTHVSSHIQPGKFKHQNLFSGCEVSSGNANAINKSVDTSAKPLTMSPQEKIEKLRRRQQLQAMLAIQKQQQQFSHQISSTHQSSTQKGPQETQIQYFERADLEVEGLSTLPSLDPNSTVEQDDSSIVSAAIDDHSAEDTILYRLQYIVSKLDIKIRLCIRDSLYRLAQSAMRRHYASDTSSSNKSSKVEGEVFAEEINNHNRFGKIPDLETETNPIDRTVAHLLFHRPLNSSGKKSDASESPISTKLSCEHKTAGLVNLSNECLPDSLKNKQCFPRQGSESCRPFPEPSSVNPFKTSPLVGNSENASSTGPDDGGTMEVEASL